jgi:hypothetical protein
VIFPFSSLASAISADSLKLNELTQIPPVKPYKLVTIPNFLVVVVAIIFYSLFFELYFLTVLKAVLAFLSLFS